METNTLSIGNMVLLKKHQYSPGEIREVREIAEDSVYLNVPNCKSAITRFHESQINPLPINRNNLILMGFGEYNYARGANSFFYPYGKDGKYLLVIYNQYGFTLTSNEIGEIAITSIHQLQNLVRDIFGVILQYHSSALASKIN